MLAADLEAAAFRYREYALAAVAARRLQAPVTWIADCSDYFLGDTQDATVTTARVALDKRHRSLALEIDLVADMGAYLSQFAPFIPICANRSLGTLRYPSL